MRLNRAVLRTLIPLALLVAGTGRSLQAQQPQARQERLNQALIAAVDRNDTPLVQRLLRQGADPNTRVPVPDRPDAGSGKPDLPTKDKNATRGAVTSILMKAIGWCSPRSAVYSDGHSDNPGTVKALVDAGADVNERVLGLDTDYRWTKVKLPKTTALIVAACGSKWEVMQILLAHHADVNASDDYGDTALMYTARLWFQGGEDMVQKLLDRGARVDAKDDFGETALLWVFNQSEDLRHGIVPFSWPHSVSGTARRTVELLLKHGANVNIKDRNDMSVLMWAMINPGDKEVVRQLLVHGADANAVDRQGSPASYFAQDSGMIALLRQYETRK